MTVAQPTNKMRLAVVWLSTAGIAAFLLSATLNVLVSFRPYTLLSYSVDPSTVCPLDPTDVYFAAQIARPSLGHVEGFRTLSRWVEVNTGDRLSVESDWADFRGRYGQLGGTSSFTRFAPNQPGLWRIEASITTHGAQLLQPQQQTIGEIEGEPIRTNAITVLEPDAPACLVAAR